MLAYVFFHRLTTGAEATVYEEVLRRFHASLSATPSAGFRSSVSYRVEGGYADWYFVEDSAALDGLNEAAVSGPARSSHDLAARMAAEGTGKLLALVNGKPRIEPGFEIRFSKPRGLAYSDFYEQLKAWSTSPGVSLWRRMMVLGPPPEFCITSPAELDLPAEMEPVTLRRTPV